MIRRNHREEFEMLRDAQELLRSILTTDCDAGGEPFSEDDQRWACQICLSKPDWSLEVLKDCGVTDG